MKKWTPQKVKKTSNQGGVQVPRYSDEFKAEALELLERNGGNFHGTAKKLGIATKSLTTWAERAAAPAGGHVNPEEEIRRLQRKLRQAEMEREILKKAVAFFAKEKS
jgi:transposase